MRRTWSGKDWYQYHKNNAAEEAIRKYASAEKSALDALDGKIFDPDQRRKALEATRTGWTGLVASLLPTSTSREISEIRKQLDLLRTERVQLYMATRDAIRTAASRGISSYNAERLVRAEESAERARERRIRYLERSPAIRSAQATIKQHIIETYSTVDDLTCYYCSTVLLPEQAHIEHKTPVSRGGTNSRANLVLACAACNLSKGRKTEAEFRRYLERKE